MRYLADTALRLGNTILLKTNRRSSWRNKKLYSNSNNLDDQRMKTTSLFGSEKGEKHVESNLNSVEEEQSVLVRDVLEVDEVYKGPDLPRSLAGREEISLDLCSNSGKG